MSDAHDALVRLYGLACQLEDELEKQPGSRRRGQALRNARRARVALSEMCTEAMNTGELVAAVARTPK